MTQEICFDYYEIQSAFGDLSSTLAAVLVGKSAIRSGPCFNVPVPYAPFADTKCRDLAGCVQKMAAGLDRSIIKSDKTLFIYCAAKGDIRSLDAPDKKDLPSPLLSDQASIAQNALGLESCRSIVISNACTSGAIALETASDLLRAGRFDTAVIVAYDSLSNFVANGFLSLGALSPERARPFDAGRNGLTLGEGAAIAVLSRRKPQAGDVVIAGAGSTNDANHRTGPSRTGDGLCAAAVAALFEAKIVPSDVGGVKCHGTATPYNDAMEAKALYSLFGSAIPPVASVKGAIGHTSGASSLLETIIAAECLHKRILPPTAGFETPGVEEPIPVSAARQSFEKGALLCLSAGFGGVNAAIVLREAA